MPNFRSIFFEMTELWRVGRIYPPHPKDPMWNRIKIFRKLQQAIGREKNPH